MDRKAREPVFGASDQVRLDPVCSATETSQNNEIWHIVSSTILLARHRISKELIRLRACAGWSATLLFVYNS